MKTVIAPEYQHLEGFIRAVPQGGYPREKVWRNRRNTVELVRVDGEPLVVKKYKRPTLANCVIYTLFRKNKAQKAWENALLFQAKGLETAAPVAYIVIKKYGFVHTCYFISQYLDYPTIDEAVAQLTTDEERHELGRAFVDFTVRLHESRIVHRDYNQGNILAHREADGWHFALIDINRLDLDRTPGLQESMKSMEMLHLDLRALGYVVPEYAHQRGFDPSDAAYYLLREQHRHRFRSRVKHAFKRLIGK